MKLALPGLSLILFVSVFSIQAQNKRLPVISAKKISAGKSQSENIRAAIVIDERLAVLRKEPSLYARQIQRMRRGRLLSVTGTKSADGVIFYRVAVPPPDNYGWVQADAVIGRGRSRDEERLARLVQASEGFEQMERAILYLENFPNSQLRPPILLLLGDLAEENALKLSAEANRRLDRREMAATGAPLHSFYLNYVGLDRFRRIGISFLFNPATTSFHYDGASWKEIAGKFPTSAEVEEAQKRLDSLRQKMERTSKP